MRKKKKTWRILKFFLSLFHVSCFMASEQVVNFVVFHLYGGDIDGKGLILNAFEYLSLSFF